MPSELAHLLDEAGRMGAGVSTRPRHQGQISDGRSTLSPGFRHRKRRLVLLRVRYCGPSVSFEGG